MDSSSYVINRLDSHIEELKEDVNKGYRLDGHIITSKEHMIRGYIFAIYDANLITDDECHKYLDLVKEIVK